MLRTTSMSKFSDLFPALVECFAIILFGYVSGRLSIVTPKQAEGIGKFVGSFALPALLFKSMVELTFDTVSWSFMVSVLMGKLIIFTLVLGFSLIMIKDRKIARASLYAIFTTQSNDFALGYPLVFALYGKSHPEFLQYIYLMAPVSFLVLNPIGFVLLEIDKHRSQEQEYMILTEEGDASTEDDRSLHIGEAVNVVDEDLIESDEEGDTLMPMPAQENQQGFTARTCLNILKGILLNPLIFMVLIGLAGHFIFHGKLPPVLGETLGTLAKAFSGTALFYLGLSMVGKVGQQQGIGLVIPASLIVVKIIFLPIIIREFVLVFTNILPVYVPTGISRNSTNMTDYIYALADFGYLYGTFPTAPTVVIYAAQYGIEVDRLAAGMVFCTSLSAPIMYVSAWTLSMSKMSQEFFQKEVKEVDKDISFITLFCSVWCIVIFVIGRKFLKVPHVITLGYIFTLFISSIGTILWDDFGNDTIHSTRLFLFGLMYFGVQSARAFTPSIALALVVVLSRGQRWLWNYCWSFILIPFAVGFIVTIALMSSAEMSPTTKDHVFIYGKAQDIVSVVVIGTSFFITLFCLVLILKMHGIHHGANAEDPTKSPLIPKSSTEVSLSDDDSENSLERTEVFCLFERKCVTGDIQKGRHIVLLLLLTLSMFIGICLVLWRLTSSGLEGVYFEVAFLDSVFNFGQGFFVFCVFGLDSDLIIDPFVRIYHKLRYGSEDISLPDFSDMDKAALLQCLQFTRYHLDDCKLEIVKECRSGLTRYPEVFTGKDFCTWLIDRGLVSDRAEARIYGQNLLWGRVLYHHTRKHYFHDHNYLYKFEEPRTCYRVVRTNISNSGLNSPDLRMAPSPSGDVNIPTTSAKFQVPHSPSRVASPVRRSYYGYSFEAHISSSEPDGPPGSLRKFLHTTVSHLPKATSLSNSANNNSSTTSDPSTAENSTDRLAKRKPLKKILPVPKRGRSGDHSDSSF